MTNYRINKIAEEDLLRIYQYGVKSFGVVQAEKYFNSFFEYFKTIAENPYSFESVDYIKLGYRRCVCGSDSIYFRINETDSIIEIMTIIGRQDLNNIL